MDYRGISVNTSNSYLMGALWALTNAASPVCYSLQGNTMSWSGGNRESSLASATVGHLPGKEAALYYCWGFLEHLCSSWGCLVSIATALTGWMEQGGQQFHQFQSEYLMFTFHPWRAWLLFERQQSSLPLLWCQFVEPSVLLESFVGDSFNIQNPIQRLPTWEVSKRTTVCL